MVESKDDKKRVLYYVERYLPASQAFVAQQAKALCRFAPSVLTGSLMTSPSRDILQCPVHSIASSKTMKIGELGLKIARLPIPALFPCVKEADILHAHFGKNGYVISPLARAFRKPLVTTFHGFDATYRGDPKTPGGFNQVRFFAQGRSEMARSSGWSLAVSDFIESKLLELGFSQERIFRHYIGIDTSLFAPSSAPRRKGLVVSIARFMEYKGHRFMIEALKRVASQGIELEFVMVGQGPLRNEIEALARRELPNVTVHDQLTQSEIRELLGQAMVYLHGSVTLDNGHAEAMGIANLEAQALGTPVVAFRSGGVGEAVEDGRSGFLIAERDIDGMAGAITKLLTDDDNWQAFSDRAAKLVPEKFDVVKQCASLEDYYDEVLKRSLSEAKL